ncbi:hypothetical protein NQ176_g9425 [Zarea fungicola]|uniref:Uncharacterized protein n=1 Tax=Zarea fungicola TaxID=93591 RepID=A0ACC1MMS9_9HYPO|nr:hypothetical protein NQ176_g9425 [Lecanicillium fungicola]
MNPFLDLPLLYLISDAMSELKQLSRSNDKSLAEFLLMMSLRIGWTGGFRKRLDDIGPDFPPSFLDSLDRLAMAMHPECKRMDTTSGKMRHVHDGQGNEYRGDKALSDALNLTQQPSQGGSIQSTALAQCDEKLGKFNHLNTEEASQLTSRELLQA